MRTTVDLPEHLLVESKKLAAERRVPLTRVFEESVRAYLSEQRRRSPVAPSLLPLLREPAPLPGVDLNDTSRLWEIE
jgi:hypothetical protein